MDWAKSSVLFGAKDLEYGTWGNQKLIIPAFFKNVNKHSVPGDLPLQMVQDQFA